MTAATGEPNSKLLLTIVLKHHPGLVFQELRVEIDAWARLDLDLRTAAN